MATKITYTDKVKSVDIPNPAVEKFRADDANEIKVVVNSHADDIDTINLDVAAVESDIINIESDILALESGKVGGSIASGQVAFGSDLAAITGEDSFAYDSAANQLTADNIKLNGGGAGTNEGNLSWNDTDGTLDLELKGGNVTLQVGQEEVVRVVNGTGVDLLESQYKAVKIIGAQGQRLQVDFALADSDINSATTIGLVTENISNNQEGFITTIGSVRNINTTGSLQSETWADGDVLYLSPTVEGGLTNVKPETPAHLVVVGFVEYAHAVNGKIYVKVDNGYEIEELHDVLITSLSDNELLQYNSAEGYWENRTLAEAGIQPLGNYLESGDNVSELINDAGYLTSAPVDSVAGKTGDVTLVKADITDFSDADYATAAQGLLANTSIQPSDNVSELVNDAGYITSAPVDSVAGKTGIVTLVKADITDFSDLDYATAAQGLLADSAIQSGDNISELINDSGYITSAPVDSVAGKTGVVTLVKADITDFSDADYATAAQGITADNSIQKNIGATYTTNALTAVTQAEYDALTPDATTIYFIV